MLRITRRGLLSMLTVVSASFAIIIPSVFRSMNHRGGWILRAEDE